MTITAATDAELAGLAKHGDLEAFGALYERYFGKVYDYLSRMTMNPGLAADVTKDTFVSAMQRVDQLEDPDRFRAWLYTIARTQAVNRIEYTDRSAKSETASGDKTPGSLDRYFKLGSFHDSEEAARVADVADLVWAAAASLDERTYTVLDLSVRQELTSAEIADVMGVSIGNASVMVNRMMNRAQKAISTYLVMCLGSKDCEELHTIVGGQTTALDAALGAEVDRHIIVCETCSTTRRKIATPPQVMAAYARIVAPGILYTSTWDDIATRWRKEGPRHRRARNLVRAEAFATSVILISALGVAAAVQLNDPPPDATEIETIASVGQTPIEDEVDPFVLTTSTMSSTSTTTTTTSVTTATDAATATTVATTTTGPQTTTTEATPPPPPPTTSTTAPPPTTTSTLQSNQPPVVTIIAPGDGDHFRSTASQPFPVTLEATVTDDFETGLIAQWFEEGTQLGSGNSITLLFSAGCPTAVSHTVIASVTDSGGLIGSDTITFTVGCVPIP